ncbi:MAG: hypothetical protein R2874_04055 [Desulfobacterales bacterium]
MLSAKSSEEASTDTIILNIIHLIAAASGHKGMIDGQMRDIEAENTTPLLDALKKIHYLKTGALIEAAVVSGALLARGDIKAIEKLGFTPTISAWHSRWPTIFTPNVEGDAATMGKPRGPTPPETSNLSRHSGTGKIQGSSPPNLSTRPCMP